MHKCPNHILLWGLSIVLLGSFFLCAEEGDDSRHGIPLLVSRCADTDGWTTCWARTADIALAAESKAGKDAIRCSFHFREDSYAGLEYAVAIPEATNLSFQLYSDLGTFGFFRVLDDAGQWHQHGLPPMKKGGWRTFSVDLDPAHLTAHWGGKNDGVLHFPIRRLFFALGKPKGQDGPDQGMFWVSDVQMLQSAPSPSDTLRVRFQPLEALGVHFMGQVARYRLTVENRMAADRNLVLTMTYTGAEGKRRDQVIPVRLKHFGVDVQEFSIPCDRIGYTELWATLLEGGDAVAEAVSGLAVVHRLPNYGKPDPDSWFGGMIIADYEAAERIGCKTVRPQAYWKYLMKGKEEYRWDALDREIAAAAEHGMSTILTVRPEKTPSWASWKRVHELVEDANVANYRQFVADLLDRYGSRLSAIEICNEPDLEMYQSAGYRFDEGGEIYAKLLREGCMVTREKIPDLPVIGLCVSGVDTRRDLAYTRAVLGKASAYLDINGIHPYTDSRYIGRGRRALFPMDYGLREKLAGCAKAMADAGAPSRIWSTELGWALAVDASPLSDDSRAYAAYVSRALATARSVPEVEKLIFFCMKPLESFQRRGHCYSLFRSAAPDGRIAYASQAAAAYAASAYMLHHVKPVAPVSVGGAVSGFHFQSQETGLCTTVLWAGSSRELVLSALLPPDVHVFDMLGVPIDTDVNQGLPISEDPVYVQAPVASSDIVLASLKNGRLSTDQPIEVLNAYFYHLDKLEMELLNPLGHDETVTIGIDGRRIERILSKGKHHINLTISGVENPLPILLETSGKDISLRIPRDYLVIPWMEEHRIDGALTEASWKPVSLMRRNNLIPPDAPWSGSEDLSVKAWFGWNADGFYTAFSVEDDIHTVPKSSPGNFWQSDSVQFILDADADSLEKLDEDDAFLGFVLGNDGLTHCYSTKGAPGVFPGDVKAARIGSKTVYEGFFSWDALGMIPPVSGRVVSLNFIVNENDGDGRTHWMGLTPGIGETRTPAQYREFVFIQLPEQAQPR